MRRQALLGFAVGIGATAAVGLVAAAQHENYHPTAEPAATAAVASASRWQVVSVAGVNGSKSSYPSSILLDTQTGETWLQTYAALPRGNGADDCEVPYWFKMPKAMPTTRPSDW